MKTLKEDVGLRSHRQVVVDMGRRDSEGCLCPQCSLSPTLHQHITLGKSFNFPLVRIAIHQVRARISLSLKGWGLGYLQLAAGVWEIAMRSPLLAPSPHSRS